MLEKAQSVVQFSQRKYQLEFFFQLMRRFCNYQRIAVSDISHFCILTNWFSFVFSSFFAISEEITLPITTVLMQMNLIFTGKASASNWNQLRENDTSMPVALRIWKQSISDLITFEIGNIEFICLYFTLLEME